MSNPTLLGTGGHKDGSFSGTTYYSNVGLGRSPMIAQFTNEATVGQASPLAGTISYLSWGWDTALGVSLTLVLNKNSSSTVLAVAIGAATTGWVTDSTHSASLSSGDTLDFGASLNSGTSYSGSFYCISARFDATTNSAQMIAAVGPNPISPTVSPRFFNFLGIAGAPALIESDKQFKSLSAGTWKSMACYIANNTFTKGTTAANRINGASGSMAISIPQSTSGYFADNISTHTDAVAAGDFLDYAFAATEAGGANNFNIDWIGAHFWATDSSLCMIGGSPDAPALVPDPRNPSESTYYSSLFGGGTIGPPAPRASGLFPYALNASKYTNHITDASQIPHQAAATFTLLKNGAASALAVSATGGATGYFTDNTHSVDFAVGDTCANRIVLTSNLTNTYIAWAGAALLLEAS